MPEFSKKFSRLANRLLASRHAISGRRLALAYRGAITWAAYRRYVKSRDRADLDKAIEAFTTLVVLMPDTHPRKAAVLHIRGILLSDRVEHTGAVSDIDEMITTYENAVRLADSHDIPVYLGKLGKGYATRFEETAEFPDADKAIDALTRAVNATTEEGETKADRLCDVGDILLARLQKSGDLADGDRALVSYEHAIQAMPSVDPDLPHYLDNLANAHLVRSEYSHDIRDIDNAITTLLRAVGLTEQGCTPESRPFVLTNLGNAYMKKYGMTDESKDFDHAVQAQQEALGMTADDPTNRVTFLNNLGLVYLTQFKLHEALEDVDQAIAHLQEASVLAKSGHGDLAGCLTNLGDALSRRFARSGSLADIDKAITLHEEAVLASQDDTKAACHCNLGTALLSRFERSQDLSDVDRSVRAHSAAVDLTPERNADIATYLNGLGVACRNRFRLTLDMKDIDDAILNHESALGLLSDEHPERAATLSSLGAAYGARFLYRGDPTSDIDRAITSQSDAVRLTGETSPDRANRLRNLAIAWSQKFDRTGDLIDIGEAILKAEDAVRCTVDDHAALPANLACLAVCLSSRFDRSGELADVDRAITVMEEAVELAPEDSVDKAMCLSGLGYSFMARFERTKDVKDIDQAVHCSDESVRLTPDSQAEDRAISLGNLGRALKHRFDHLKEPKDLDSAVDALQRCLDLTQHDNVDKPHRLGELASAFTARFVCSGERADIDSAITMYEDAVALLPNGHSGESNLLSSLGHALLYEAHIQSAPDDRRAAVRHFRLAAQSPTGLPLDRFRAALEWARLSVAMSDSSEQSYLDGYGLALELLQRVAWVGQTITARHREIAALGNIASEAAAAAITAGNASLAVKWLEQGRSVIWGQLLRLRSPVDELRAHDERLADDLEQVTKALEQTSTRVVYNFPFSPRSLRDPQHMAAEHVAQRHLLLAQEWDMLIARARAYSPDFLRAREVTDLAARRPHCRRQRTSLPLRRSRPAGRTLESRARSPEPQHGESERHALHDAHGPGRRKSESSDKPTRCTCLAERTRLAGYPHGRHAWRAVGLRCLSGVLASGHQGAFAPMDSVRRRLLIEDTYRRFSLTTSIPLGSGGV